MSKTPAQAKPAIESIAQKLAAIGVSSDFLTQQAAPARDLKLEVQGVGPVRFPVSPATARKLCAVAKPAKHGYKSETRLDRRVRDTGEIGPGRISIDEARWNKTLAPQLERIRRGLGLPEGSRLTARLHNLLVYAPGQFFAPHQDSEKHDGMIGTLVVTLPSAFKGGALLVKHHGKERSVGGSASTLTFTAFYADCSHEVKPVKQGYRIVLTYNLVAHGADRGGVSAANVAALTESLRRHFATPRISRWAGDREAGPPDRLIYLLDHQYTQRGLAWSQLKGADAARATALREAAAKLDCEIALALADVHETWQSEDDYDGYSSRHRRRDWNDDDDDEPELQDLIDSDIELRHGVGAGAKSLALKRGVGSEELCCTKPSVEFEPFKSEHEGYMGNYGNTVDRWYHRAAVALWPRERNFVIRAKGSPAWALAEIGKTLKKGDATQAAALANRMLPFWEQSVRGDGKAKVFATVLDVAARLDSSQLAAKLLEPFKLWQLTASSAAHLRKLLGRHGFDWCHAQVQRWSSSREYGPEHEHLKWLNAVATGLCRALSAAPDERRLAQSVLDSQWTWLTQGLRRLHEHTAPREMPRELAPWLKALLALREGSRSAEHAELGAAIDGFLADEAVGYPLAARIALLRHAHAGRERENLRALNLLPLRQHCAQELSQQLAQPPRAADDWSIATTVRVPQGLGEPLHRFLKSREQSTFEWPLPENYRTVIQGVINSYDLPISHVTRRSGRPFTLALTKTRALFEREAAQRRQWREDLEWLEKTAADFRPPAVA